MATNVLLSQQEDEAKFGSNVPFAEPAWCVVPSLGTYLFLVALYLAGSWSAA